MPYPMLFFSYKLPALAPEPVELPHKSIEKYYYTFRYEIMD